MTQWPQAANRSNPRHNAIDRIALWTVNTPKTRPTNPAAESISDWLLEEYKQVYGTLKQTRNHMLDITMTEQTYITCDNREVKMSTRHSSKNACSANIRFPSQQVVNAGERDKGTPRQHNYEEPMNEIQHWRPTYIEGVRPSAHIRT